MIMRDQPSITLQGQALQEVESFSYQGNEVSQNVEIEKEIEKEAVVRIEKAGKVYQMWEGKSSGAIISARPPKCNQHP